MTKRNGVELTSGIITLILAVAGTILFFLSYSTGYYIYGQMNSGIITALALVGIAMEIVALIVRGKMPETLWPKLLTFCVTALLTGAAMLLIGDRVEGIGNCIITDYDSGHGGEEAIYMSLAGAALFLIAVIYNIIGSFAKDRTEKSMKGAAIARSVGFGASAAAVLGVTAAVLLPALGITGGNGAGGTVGGGGSAETYTISYNQENGNVEGMPGFQFLCSDLSGMAAADSRFYIDEKLTLDGNGNYTLFTDAYVVEAGKRAEIGDDTGLGMVLTTNAEGTYTDNGDGTITTAVPTHAVFEMKTDTYSSQMKGAAQMNVNGNEEDGVYDSDEEAAVLDFVPETVWTLADGAIVSYRDANAGGSYTVSFNQEFGNTEGMPDYQFLCSDLSGMVAADSRFYIDVALDLDGNGEYKLSTDSYVIEAGKRAEIGDDTGLGMVLTTNAEGTYTENEDGTITTSVPTHAVFEMETDTYSSQMKGAAQMNVNGNDADGVYDSDEEPAVLDFVPETIWTLDDDADAIIGWMNPNAEEEDAKEASDADETAADAEEADPADETSSAALEVISDDEGTTFTFHPDGTYRFYFESYDVEDLGTYTFEDGVLTITNANEAEVTAEGDPLKFHYVTSVSDQLAGDYTVDATALEAVVNGEKDEAASSDQAEEITTVTSEDGATTLTFYKDGTYRFYFEAYDVEDFGTYTFEDGSLTLVNANEAEVTTKGDPLKFHYVTAVSDQLAGDFSLGSADFSK